jgi:oxygen-independent coproporphyrinogen-3 oxidase
MLLSGTPDVDAVRYSTPDSLEGFIQDASAKTTLVSRQAALEETFFLGLRLTEGVDLSRVQARFDNDFLAEITGSIDDCVRMELLERQNDRIKLTDRGRLLSNEVFEQFISVNA